MVSTGSPSPLWVSSANVIPVEPWEALALLAHRTFYSFTTPSSPVPIATYLCSISWTSVHVLHLFPYLILTLFPAFFYSSQVPPTLLFPCLFCSPFQVGLKHPFFGLPSPWASLWSVSFIESISHSLPNIHLSISIFCACSFETELPHSGWYFLDTSTCLQTSGTHCF